MAWDTGTQITINGIGCWEESCVEHFDRNGGTATRVIVCAWANRGALIAHLLGGALNIGGVIFNYSTQSYPDSNTLFVSVDPVEGIDGSTGKTLGPNGQVAYKYARLNVNYRTLDLSQSQIQSTTGIDFGKECFAASREAVKFADGTPVPFPPPITVPTLCITKARSQLTAIPFNAIIAALNAPLNNAPALNVATGHLLFDGGRSILRQGLGGSLFDLELRFVARGKLRWDEVFDNTGVPQRVKRRDGSDLIDMSDLNNLLTAIS